MNRYELKRTAASVALLSCCAAACGGDITELGADTLAPNYEETPDHETTLRGVGQPLVRASLDLEGADLVMSLSNEANYDASVSLRVFVMTETANSSNDAGKVHINAGETLRQVVPASQLEGFDVAHADWLRAELHYRFELDNGDTAAYLTGLGTQFGAVVPHAEAIERGLVVGDMQLDGPRVTEKAGASFKFCITNRLTLKPSPGFNGDGLTPSLSSDRPLVAMPGQVYAAYFPTSNTTPVLRGTLDAAGCTELIPRRGVAGQAETWKFRPILYTFSGSAGVLAIDSNGVTPGADLTVTVPAAGNPSSRELELSGNQALLQAATFLSNHTTRRVNQIGVTVEQSLLKIQITTLPTTSHYCSQALPAPSQDCPGPQVMRVTASDANDRHTIAHETGHWIHHRNTSVLHNNSYRYSQANAPGADLCEDRRSAQGHGSTHIETPPRWAISRTEAHTELSPPRGSYNYRPSSLA